MPDPFDDALEPTDPIIRPPAHTLTASDSSPKPVYYRKDQVEGTSDGLSKPDNSLLTGWAFEVSQDGQVTDKWVVRVIYQDDPDKPCAGGFTSGEYWPWAPPQWPDEFSIQLTRYSYLKAGKVKWYDQDGLLKPGPTKSTTYDGGDWKPIQKAAAPKKPHTEVRKNGTLVAYVDTHDGDAKWSHPDLPNGGTIKLDHDDVLTFSRKAP